MQPEGERERTRRAGGSGFPCDGPSPFGSARAAPRSSGPVPRPLRRAPAGPDLVWPSQWWTSHECPERRRCPHPMPLPPWWLLMAARGIPLHPDVAQAHQLALRRIRTYKGSKPVFDEPTRLLVQGIVIDALIAAPQPVAGGWVHTSLMAVGGLTRWAWMNAEPLQRDHLLSTHTRNRFLNLGCKGLKDASVNNYRCRLDLIAQALFRTPLLPTTTRTLTPGEPVDPHTASETANLWVWAHGLRPAKRRDRVHATLALGLGCGLRSSEHIHVRPQDVTTDPDGVHVTVQGKYGTRLVTCDAVWADRLLQVVADTPTGHRLSSPWRAPSATARGVQNAVRIAQEAYPPPVRFSPRSLRNTWLVTRLTAGTPIPTLLDAAGIGSIEAFRPFLRFVTAPTPGVRARSLRDR